MTVPPIRVHWQKGHDICLFELKSEDVINCFICQPTKISFAFGLLCSGGKKTGGLMKTTKEYWNTLAEENSGMWEVIEGSDGNLTQLTIAQDPSSGDYTRLTKFKDGYCTKCFGEKSHNYPEEIFVVSGRLYDEAFDQWLEPGFYASRPPGEIHGPFTAEGEVVILEVSFPSQAV